MVLKNKLQLKKARPQIVLTAKIRLVMKSHQLIAGFFPIVVLYLKQIV